jgi:hypothetical protein
MAAVRAADAMQRTDTQYVQESSGGIRRAQPIAILGRLGDAKVDASHSTGDGAYAALRLDHRHQPLEEAVEFGLGNHAAILAECASRKQLPRDSQRTGPS